MTIAPPIRPLPVLVSALLAVLVSSFLVVLSADRPASAGTGYDAAVLADHPVAYFAAADGTVDLTGRGHNGTALGGSGGTALLPDGESARTYDGVSQYVTVPTSPDFSIPTTRALTWEAWIRPAVLQFAHSTGGYVDFMGKCASYSPSCEWESRMYNAVNSQNRPSRISAYVFKPTAGLGSAADWQPVSGTFTAGGWVHVVGEYQTVTTPSACSSTYPGTINIWVDGVKQNFASHAPTGCMSQYSVVPRAGTSPLNIGTMARDSWFQGAIGKVAVYAGLLSQARITAHFTAMTGLTPSGSCASSCTLAVQPGPGPTTATTITPLAPSGSVPSASASVRVTSSWSSGYCAAVTVSTGGPDLSSWVVTIPVSGRVTSLWGASWSQARSSVTLRSLSWDGVLTSTAPVTGVGFCASTR